MWFWLSILLSVFCILKTEKSERGLTAWDVLFLLSSWQIFNLKIWQAYLAPGINGNAYYPSATILILLLCWFMKRRGLNPGIRLSASDAKLVLKSLGVLLILIPIGLGMGFLNFSPEISLKFMASSALTYTIFVGIPEELVFRGILQNLLERNLKNPWLAAILSNILFAFIYTHLTGQGIFPNWKYVGLAFAAGLVYAGSYLKSSNILVPVSVHGLVDAIRDVFF